MKIGILTFHRAYNYGAFLQTFATLAFLRSQGYDVSIVDYMPEGHTDFYRFFNSYWKNSSWIGKTKYVIRKLIDYPFILNRRKKFHEMQENFFGIERSVRYITPKDLENVNYDYIIYGSDQIWWKCKFLTYKGFDLVYWGEYIPKAVKKIAYAPSMGSIDLNETDISQIKYWLTNFMAVSVREKQLSDTLFSISGNYFPVVLDPVFFLDKSQWMKRCDEVPIRHEKPYLLLYNLQNSLDARRVAISLAQRNKWKVVEIKQSFCFDFSHYYDYTSGPIEFVSLFRDAKFIVTTSFHGTAFSVIFRKPFIVVGLKFAVDRVLSLLSMLNLDDRYISSMGEDFDLRIDYSKVDPLLEAAKERSKNYIINSLNNTQSQ